MTYLVHVDHSTRTANVHHRKCQLFILRRPDTSDTYWYPEDFRTVAEAEAAAVFSRMTTVRHCGYCTPNRTEQPAMQPRQSGNPRGRWYLGAAILIGFNLLVAGWVFDVTALLVAGLVMAVVTAMVAYALSNQ